MVKKIKEVKIKKRGRPRKIKEIKKPIAKEAEKEKVIPKPEKYFEAVGRRKTSVARVRLFTRPPRGYPEKMFLVNEKPLEKYFPTFELQKITRASLEIMKCLDKFGVLVNVKGGGLNSQAEAVRHAIARALVLFNPTFRKRLKKAGFLKRDPRMKERKKFGLKRARKAPQWAKR